VKTRLKSEPFKFLIVFLGFLAQSLLPKNTNLDKNYPKRFFTQILVMLS